VFLGDGRPQFGVAAAFGLWGVAASDHRALTTASQTVEVILACGTVVQVLKHITGRQSPFVSSRPGGVWDFFPNQIEYHKHVPRFDAYPSGHIATTLATVTVIAENYPEWWWVRPVGYAVTAALGISMVNTGIHWYSDYPLGLFLGYSFGMIVSHPENVSVGHPFEGLSIAPLVLPSGGGVSLVYGI
jgi:membrane-associated PAP2 superfamily phosphatase